MACRRQPAQPVERAELGQQLARRAAGLVAGERVGLDFPFDEARDLTAQVRVLRAQVDGFNRTRFGRRLRTNRWFAFSLS